MTRTSPGGAAPELAPALSLVGAVARQRSLVAVVSDFRGPRDWRLQLVDLAARHDVLAVEIRDPREEHLVDVGEVWFADPGDRSAASCRHRRRTPAGRASPRPPPVSGADVADELAAARASHVVLSTSGDWLRDLASHLGRRR